MHFVDEFLGDEEVVDAEIIDMLDARDGAVSQRHVVHGGHGGVDLLHLRERLVGDARDGHLVSHIVGVDEVDRLSLEVDAVAVRLHLDIQLDLAFAQRKRLFQRAYPLVCECGIEPAAVVEVFDLVVRDLPELFIQTRRALEVGIVHHHEHAVGRLLHVKLHPIRALVDSVLECSQGVLGSLARAAPMRGDREIRRGLSLAFGFEYPVQRVVGQQRNESEHGEKGADRCAREPRPARTRGLVDAVRDVDAPLLREFVERGAEGG